MEDRAAAPGKTHTLRFPQLEREITAREDETLFESARRHGVRIVGACGGRGTCGSCLVQVTDGTVVETGAPLARRGRNTGKRRWLHSCQLSARGDCTIAVAPRSLAPVVRAEAAAVAGEVLALDAAVVAQDVTVPAASLQDSRSDVDRVLRALGTPDLAVDLDAARRLPAQLRESGNDREWRLRAWTQDGELIACGPCGRRTLGLAVDFGTTNVAAFLVDLDRGERVATLGVENPQVAWGADVITRINHALHGGEGAAALRTAAIEVLNALAHDLCASVGQTAADIVELAICGNTAMHHLLLGLPVRQLGRAPFVATACDGIRIRARELGLATAPGARVELAPNIGGFVGGDHVAALLATEPEWRPRQAAIVMDIGTNTEISLVVRDRLFSTSAPSGPALEGGHISCGMRAAEGAIERVSLDGGRIRIRTIGHHQPVGLCGSGVLDALAVLREGGFIDGRGRIAKQHPDIVTVAGQRAVQLAPEVHFTQLDVRAVQLAKAAIRTATALLLDEAGIAVDAIERFVIAGSFGAYIDVASGIATGLFPALPRERFVQVGNAAGLGVRRLLVSRRDRAHARELARSCRLVELSTRADFQKVFLHNIGFN